MSEVMKKEVLEAYLFLRENNTNIPDNVLDLMKDAALEKLDDTHFSFTSTAVETTVDEQKMIGAWTDGLTLFSDNQSYCAYSLKPGEQYKISVVKINS